MIGCYFERPVSFGAQHLSFGRPDASDLARSGFMERSMVTWEHNRGDLAVKALIFIRFPINNLKKPALLHVSDFLAIFMVNIIK